MTRCFVIIILENICFIQQITLSWHLQLVRFKKHPVKQPKYGDIIIELFMINTYEWFLRHTMFSYVYV